MVTATVSSAICKGLERLSVADNAARACSGPTLFIVDGNTGTFLTCQLFVAALGASSYTYAQATMRQTLSDWIG
jgi:transposase